MSSVKTTQIDGDISVGRHVAIGGDAIMQGNGHVKGRFRIDGVLEAKNIKGESADKGVFTSLENLKEAYPSPKDGWWALVGDTLPCPIYVAKNGEWAATGGTGGAATINSEKYDKKIEGLNADIRLSETRIGKNENNIEALQEETGKQGKTLLQLSTSMQETINNFLLKDAETRKEELKELRDLVNKKEGFKSAFLTEEEYREKLNNHTLESDRCYFILEEE